VTEVVRTEGVCKWFRKDYGFIDVGDGIDVFVHYSSLNQDGYRALNEGDRVSFVLTNGPKGRQAVDVTRLAVAGGG
jgi:cold shock protein